MILDTLPLVLWINLDKSEDRRFHMEKLFFTYQLRNHRITAVDDEDVDQYCKKNPMLSAAENACTVSHLTALKYFIEHTEEDRVVIFEDDVIFDFLPHIPFNWSTFESNLPSHYDIVQLAITTQRGITPIRLCKVKSDMKLYCSAAYLVSRAGAELILKKFCGSTPIDLSVHFYPTADSVILRTGVAYSIPIFTYKTDESTIHPKHLRTHSACKNRQHRMWAYFGTKSFDPITYFKTFSR